MKPIILMIVGLCACLYGLVVLIQVARTFLIVKWRSARGEDELVDTEAIRQDRKKNRTFLAIWGLCFLLSGFCVFMVGWAYGYGEQGEDFWLNQFLSGEKDISGKWDRLSEDGSYIAEDGKLYPFYLLINGDTYEFCGEKCADIDAVRAKLSKVKQGNTIILIDSFAVSATFKAAKNLVKDMGYHYETEEV